MNKLYNIFIFLSTFIRNILEIYSCIYLYQKGLSFREILLFYILVYLIGIILNIMIYFISRKVSINYLLIISIIFSIITYSLFHKSNNYLLLTILLSVSFFPYHPFLFLHPTSLSYEQQSQLNIYPLEALQNQQFDFSSS